MEKYCLNFKKSIAKKNSSVRITKQNRLMLVSNCAICDEKIQDSLTIKKQVGNWAK